MTSHPTLSAQADAEQRLRMAHMALQAGDTSRAEALAKAVIRSHPSHEAAHLLLARAQRAQGYNKQALQSCRAGLARLPHSPLLLIEQAMAQRASNRLADAESSYRQALAQDPHHAPAMHNLANLLQARGELDEAHALYQEALAQQPQMAQSHFELGNIHARRQHQMLARQSWQQALLLQPNLAAAWIALGLDLRDDQPAAAIEALQKGLQHNPNHELALAWLGKLLCDAGRCVEAEQCARMAIQMAPRLALAHYALGLALRIQGRIDAAIEPLATAASLTQDDAALLGECVYLQALCKQDRGLISQAQPHAAQLLQLSRTPQQLGMAHHVMGALLFDSGRIKEARRHFDEAVAQSPRMLQHRVSLCATAQYDGDIDGHALRRLCEEHLGGILPVASQAAVPGAGAIANAQKAASGGRIRLGFLSSDFRLHSCAFFLEPLLTHIDRERFELFAYDTGSRPDAFMARFQQLIPHWRAVEKLPPAELAQRIRDDRLDILIDLAGLTDGGRIEALASQPSPIQISWLGYLGTTGHPAWQHRLTDDWVDGPEQAALCTESPLRLPRCYVCFQPPENAPEPTALPPMLRNGHPTFGSFNNLAKLSDQTVSLWSKVLKAVPDARLLLKTKALDDAQVREHTLQRFTEHGVDPGRVQLMSWARDIGSHLDVYGLIDIALDTTPYNGVTTTCEALWMGVPVVSLAGQALASRQGLSLLNAVGLPELALLDEAVFVERCRELAAAPQRLQGWRDGLRERMAASPLTDGVGFVKAFESALNKLL